MHNWLSQASFTPATRYPLSQVYRKKEEKKGRKERKGKERKGKNISKYERKKTGPPMLVLHVLC